MLKKFLLFIFATFLLSACSEKNEKDTPAKGQIKEYTKKLEDCKESVAEEKFSQETEEAKVEVKKQVFGRGYTAEPDDIVLGNSNAKLVLVEYFSPTCPHCVNYHKRIFPEIKKKFIDTGQIQYIMREFIGNKQDLDATVLARCLGDQETYFKFMDIILEQQDNWAYNKNYREILTNIGIMGGVSAEQYAICLNDESKIKSLIENTKLVAQEPRFIGTPTFFING
ncbi:MAG: DsbA family protein, partial [Rickettsiaceae bacterium]|nr:DsbA family protein [Rickettsiaceae bacterium]